MDLVTLSIAGVFVLAGALAYFLKFKKNVSSINLPQIDTQDEIIKISEVPFEGSETEKKFTESLNAVIEQPKATLKSALTKTEASFFGRIKKALSSSAPAEVIDQIEEILYTSDLGPKTVQKLMTAVQNQLSKSDLANVDKIKGALKAEIENILIEKHTVQIGSKNLVEIIQHSASGPSVIMILGVNGAGKTTSIGKMTAQLAKENKKILVAAGDTFRAAAGGQLKVWTERAQNASSLSNAQGEVEIFWPENATDPAAVAFDALTKAKAQNFDYLILDTAGRLHTQAHLMEELKKVKRVMAKVIPEAPHNTWIVLDANSGQNALNQAVEFNKAMDLSGVVLTKMDGTAKGGIVIGVVDQLNIPVKLVGLGEKIDDLQIFDYKEYIESILG